MCVYLHVHVTLALEINAWTPESRHSVCGQTSVRKEICIQLENICGPIKSWVSFPHGRLRYAQATPCWLWKWILLDKNSHPFGCVTKHSLLKLSFNWASNVVGRGDIPAFFGGWWWRNVRADRLLTWVCMSGCRWGFWHLTDRTEDAKPFPGMCSEKDLRRAYKMSLRT